MKELRLITRIYNSIQDVEQTLWNSLIRKDNIISAWEHLAAIEVSRINDCIYQYLVFYENDKPVGCACYYYISFDLDIFNKGAAKKIISFIRKHLFSHFMRMRVIECGTPTALGNTVNWIDGINGNDILQALVKEMKIFARERGVKILIFRDFMVQDQEAFGFLGKLAFRKVGILPNTAMVNHWKDFKEYEMSLKQHHRYIVRRYLRTLKEQEVTVRVLTDYAHLAPDLQRLWQGCYDYAREYQREILTEDFFIELSRRMGDKSRLILFEKDGRAIGFLLGITSADLFQGLFAGMDYRYVRDCFLLFNIYIATIRLGIELGVKVIENGLTTISEKMNFGFKPVPMYAYMRHLSPVINPVLSGLFSMFSEVTRFENKFVFTNAYSERIYGDIGITLTDHRREVTGKLDDLSESGARISSTTKIRGRKALINFHYPQFGPDFTVKVGILWVVKRGEVFVSGLDFGNKGEPKIRELQEYLMLKNGEKEMT